MSGIAVLKVKPEARKTQTVVLTPEDAMKLLEYNRLNRPLSQPHVTRIATQIVDGKWRFNGDTIKIAAGGDVLDGQHRLWAIIESKQAVETILVSGIDPDAFSTIDTIRKSRSGSDILTLMGASRHRKAMAGALAWLLRWQSGKLVNYRAPENRIENSDIEEAFRTHQGISSAAERAAGLRRLANVSVMTFLYYILANRNSDIADRMMDTLENPAGVGINDPFFRLRAYFTSDHHMKKDALMTIALTIKAANAAQEHRTVSVLAWRQNGKTPEPFPHLTIG